MNQNKIDQKAGGNILNDSNVSAGRDVSVGGTIAGRDLNQQAPEPPWKGTIAKGLFVLCIATAILGLLALGGIMWGKLDKATGVRLIEILWGGSFLSGITRILLRK